MVICLEQGADLHMAQLVPLSLASVKSRLVLPFWYRLTRVVLDKGPLNVCVCVCLCLCLFGVKCPKPPVLAGVDVLSHRVITVISSYKLLHCGSYLLQVAMPLLFQGHIDLLEEYLSRSRDQQVAFVQLIDQLIDAKTNIDVIVR